MSSIVPSRGSGAVATGSASAGGTKSVDDHGWDEAVLSLDSLGASIPRLDGAPFAEMFSPDRGVRRGANGHSRRRTGWRAYRAGVVVVRQTQQLRPRPDGRLAPEGPWVTEVSTHLALTEPRRRVGDVDADDGPGKVEEAGAPSADTEAMSQIAYLPAVVRCGFLSVVSAPDVFAAEAQQMQEAHGRITYSVRALRLIDTAAVALLAMRDQHARRWRVEQVVYAFASDRRQVGT